MELRVAGVTTTGIVCEIPAKEAVIVAEPGELASSTPVLEMLAILGFEEFQCTKDVKSCVELSEKIPIAVIC